MAYSAVFTMPSHSMDVIHYQRQWNGIWIKLYIYGSYGYHGSNEANYFYLNAVIGFA